MLILDVLAIGHRANSNEEAAKDSAGCRDENLDDGDERRGESTTAGRLVANKRSA